MSFIAVFLAASDETGAPSGMVWGSIFIGFVIAMNANGMRQTMFLTHAGGHCC